MNKKYKHIILGIFTFLIALSCEDEDKQLFGDFQQGAIPLFTQGDADTGFIDFSDIGASNLSFSLVTEGEVQVSSVDLIVTYNNSITGASDQVKYSSVTAFPASFNLSVDQIVKAFDSKVLTMDSIDVGDSFIIGGNVMTSDGRYLDGGYSPSVMNKPVILTYNVACASDLGGTYDLTLIAGENDEASFLANQTITEVGNGYYEISDISIGLLADTPIKYRFTDICGQLVADEESIDFGDQIAIRLNPSTRIDPETGEITFEVEYISPTCCGIEGIITKYKATPK